MTSQSSAQPVQSLDDAPRLETLLLMLKTGDFQSRWDAAKAIPAVGEAAIPPLLELLQEEEDWELLWFVARILGSFNHPAVIQALVDLLQSTEDSEIAAITATALTNFGDAAVPALTELLPQAATRLIVVQALAQVRHPSVVLPLLSMVKDADSAVRAAAIEALSHFYDPAVTAALQSALQDTAAKVRRAAVVGLGIQANQHESTQIVELLSPLLWDLNLEVCRQTVVALGRVGSPAAIAVLTDILQSTHTPVELKMEIVRVLVWIGNASALEPLQRQLDLSATATDAVLINQDIDREIVAVLGRVEATEAKPIAGQLLLHLLHTNHPIVQTPQGKQQIALSLGQLQDAQAIAALVPLLSDLVVSVQLHAVAALKQIPGAYESLQTLLHTSSAELKPGIEMALREW